MARNTEAAQAHPNAAQVLAAVRSNLPTDAANLEYLEIQQASPHEYSVRYKEQIRGEYRVFVAKVPGQAG